MLNAVGLQEIIALKKIRVIAARPHAPARERDFHGATKPSRPHRGRKGALLYRTQDLVGDFRRQRNIAILDHDLLTGFGQDHFEKFLFDRRQRFVRMFIDIDV